jgi:dolichyl-phosphate-mannose--protein O-mannosyl transferase
MMAVGWFVLCDTAFLIESRLILTDGVLFLSDCAAVAFSFASVHVAPFSLASFVYLVLTGLSLGVAMSTKFTAMGIVGTVGVQQFFALISHYSRRSDEANRRRLRALSKRLAPSGAAASSATTAAASSAEKESNQAPDQQVPSRFSSEAAVVADGVIRATILLGLMSAMMYGSWVLHMHLLPYSGEGDIFHTPAFLHSLKKQDGSRAAELPEGREPMTLHERIFGELIPVMHSVNMGLSTKHPFSSYWYSWPLAQFRAVLYWQKTMPNGHGNGMWLWLVGNPAVWAPAFIVGIVGTVVVALYTSGYSMLASNRARRTALAQQRMPELVAQYTASHSWSLAVLFIGYLGNLVPYILIPRETWSYHYLPALLFAIFLAGMIVDILIKASRHASSSSFRVLCKLMLVVLVCMVGVTFAFLSPWVYCWPMTVKQSDSRMLFRAWSNWGTA